MKHHEVREDPTMLTRNGISRRHVLTMAGAAGSLALAGSRSGLAQTSKRIEKLDPGLDTIIDTSQSIQELASGFGGELGPAEGPVWWKEGGYLLFSDIHNNKRMKYTPGHDRRPGTGGSPASELHRQVCSALPQPRVHAAVSGSFSGGFQRETVNRPHRSAGGYVLRSIPCPGRQQHSEHRRSIRCRGDEIHADPLPQGARGCEYQVHPGLDRQVEILSGYSSRGGFHR